MTRGCLLGLLFSLWLPASNLQAAPWQRPEPLRSDLESLSPSTQAMQRRDSDNPGWLAVQLGEQLYARPDGQRQQACSHCHGSPSAGQGSPGAGQTEALPRKAMKPLKLQLPRYPRMDELTGQPLDLSGRIEACRQRHQQAAAWTREDPRRLALQAYVAAQARGLPLQPDPDPRLVPARQRGHALYHRRIGQLELSCADCHDRSWGKRLGGSLIPQGHPNAYPLWRMQWQALGSLQRRMRACLAGVRAAPWPDEDPAWIELELYLQWRAEGLALETPGVRP